jgi:predicted enzyme related to lactoylglutathione lyase
VKVIEMAFAGYAVTDVARARKFYEGTLGLKQTSIWEGEQMCWIEYDIGPGTLAIGSGAPGWKSSPDGGRVGLEVEDFDAAVERLEADKVPFIVPPGDTPVCRMAIISDPDGNVLIIHKRKPGSGM